MPISRKRGKPFVKRCAVCRASFKVPVNAKTADERTLCKACRKRLTLTPSGITAKEDYNHIEPEGYDYEKNPDAFEGIF